MALGRIPRIVRSAVLHGWTSTKHARYEPPLGGKLVLVTQRRFNPSRESQTASFCFHEFDTRESILPRNPIGHHDLAVTTPVPKIGPIRS